MCLMSEVEEYKSILSLSNLICGLFEQTMLVFACVHSVYYTHTKERENFIRTFYLEDAELRGCASVQKFIEFKNANRWRINHRIV